MSSGHYVASMLERDPQESHAGDIKHTSKAGVPRLSPWALSPSQTQRRAEMKTCPFTAKQTWQTLCMGAITRFLHWTVFLFLNWGIIDIHYFSFTCTTLWFDICMYCKMITIIVVNIRHQSYNIFFLCWELWRSTLSNFPMCNTVLLTIVTMLCITSSGLTCLIDRSLYWIFLY